MTDATASRLDQALAAVRDDAPAARDEAESAQRVARALGIDTSTGATDYESLIPDYLAGCLNSAMILLFEQEVRESIALRRALDAARAGPCAGDSQARGVERLGISRARRGRRNRVRWAFAAAAAVSMAVATLLLLPVVADDQRNLARLDAVQGMVYRESGSTWVPVTLGEWVDGRKKLVTVKDSTVVLAVDDGSLVEVGPRSQLVLWREAGGNRVRVGWGRIIVQAAPQRTGTFDVATDDLLVAVRGTTFGVSHGTKGSRVSVIEGEVEVRHGGERKKLQAGHQLGTGKTTATRVEDAIAWSRDADRYAELLNTYADFKRDLDAVMKTTRRHSTRLLDLAPARTAIYVAVPNAPATMADAYEVVDSFRARLLGDGSSVPAEQAWVEEIVTWLGEVGKHLGAETVVALRWDDTGEPPTPLVLAEAKVDGLREVIEDKLALLAGARVGPGLEVEVIDEPGHARADVLSVWLGNGLLAASTSRALLLDLEAVLGGAENPFVGTALHTRLAEVYERGVEYLGGADFVPLGLGDVRDPTGAGLVDFGGARTAIVERRSEGDHASATVEIRFDGEDADRIAWLDRPGRLGALEFFSPDTILAGAFALRNPEELIDTFLRPRLEVDSNELAALGLLEDLMGSLGGELAVAVDGPLLPVPSWKAVVEVYDQARCQDAVESLLAFLKSASGDDQFRIERVDGADAHEPVYRIVGDGLSSRYAHYAYIDGYLVVAANRALLDLARRTYQSGVTLVEDAKFRELLPVDSYLDFSAIGYARLDDVLGWSPGSILALPMVSVVEDTRSAQSKAPDDVRREFGGASLWGLYNEPDRIRVVTNGESWTALQALPVLPLLIESAAGAGT